MSQSDCSLQLGVTPTAPSMLSSSVEDDLLPPSYEEARQAPSGVNFGSLSSPSQPLGADAGISGHPPVDHGAAGRACPGQMEAAYTEPTQPATNSTFDDAPPSYQSLFGQIKEAKESSSGIVDFISTVVATPLVCLFGLGAVAVVLGLVFGLPVTLITVGSLYLYDCPVAPGIPIWMLVGGVALIVFFIWVVCSGEGAVACQAIFGVLFYVAWYIAGCVLIYPTWRSAPDLSPEGEQKYCNYALMLTGFIIINILCVLSAVLCRYACSACKSAVEETNEAGSGGSADGRAAAELADAD